MVSRENKIILGFGVLALLLVAVGTQFAWWNTWLLLAVVIVVGVLFPLAIVDGLDGDD
ncbi:hypothetical protein SAMN04488063_2543 [Halopelagius inordinatus]|uniref:Major facilitator superfamily (MFS) profile domain-containing protein n=1 Tax=Halopelagius inordinatus TaxID=553467 RepID=A0A1I2T5E2_9EURY|nr:hypothetical protein [Halopelagius inordinatus]SFG60040.1 hypothetical protein SAMN04488063_2543 [Halopelagius inordinatus]